MVSVRPLAILLILGAGLLAYYNSFPAPFIFDDIHAIPENPHVRSLWPLTRALDGPPDSSVVARPVVALSLALNYALGGLDVRGYHAVNLALHLACALLLYSLLRRTLVRPALRRACGAAAPGLALGISILWAVHPVLTEAVTYVIQRTELLMAVFYLLTLYCAIRAAGPKAKRSRWEAGAVVSCALGMASKEVMATAPVMVLLYDWVFDERPLKRLWRERGRLYLGLSSTWIIVAVLVLTHPRAQIGLDLHGLNVFTNAMTQLGVVGHYLRLAVWPVPLVLDYGPWPVTRSLLAMPLSGMLTALLLAASVWATARRHPAGYAGMWFFVLLAPASLTPMPTEIAAERRMYLSLIAVIACLAVGAWHLLSRLRLGEQRRNLIGISLAAALAVIGIAATDARNRLYQDTIALWRQTIDHRPGNPRAHSNLGTLLINAGDTRGAEAEFRAAVALKPDFARARSNLCHALDAQGRSEEAFPHCREAVLHDPRDAVVIHNYAVALAKQGQTREAIAQLQDALRIRPDFPEARRNLDLLQQ